MKCVIRYTSVIIRNILFLPICNKMQWKINKKMLISGFYTNIKLKIINWFSLRNFTNLIIFIKDHSLIGLKNYTHILSCYFDIYNKLYDWEHMCIHVQKLRNTDEIYPGTIPPVY